MTRYRAIPLALALAAAAAFGACGDDDDGAITCTTSSLNFSNIGCTVEALECSDGSEYTVDCLASADGYNCQCRVDNTLDSEFASMDYCDAENTPSFEESCGWMVEMGLP